MSTDISPAYEALDVADATVQRLHDDCCEPGRSPRMTELAVTLTRARTAMEALDDEPGSADAVIAILESAGEQVGSLQVGCCAPGRMSLYAETLASLMKAQRAINRSMGRGH